MTEMTKILHGFSTDISHLSLPAQFTYPFCYTPHPLCIEAAEEVKRYLAARKDWEEELNRGKMFGVLIVKLPQTGQVAFLAAFSGILAGCNRHDYFVPPVFDLLDPQGYFKQEEACISRINETIQKLEAGDREPGQQQQNDQDISDQILLLKEERKQRSAALQAWIFDQFLVRNALGEDKCLTEIFKYTAHKTPPAGAGECAGPKLLQAAYLHGWQPIAMAEFWWGASPKSEVRHHGCYYPACQGKCKPILGYMLQGLDVEANPMEARMHAHNNSRLEVAYEDDWMVVVNKPAGMLSVPGRTEAESVISLLQKQYDTTSLMTVHRLDMATSGLLMVAKSSKAHAVLQKMFMDREVKKQYTAILEGIVKEDEGVIDLPLCPNYHNRPLQMVDDVHGKPATTLYKVLERKDGTTRISFTPLTGRTHQLRMHAAHERGLGCPILGDTLYGHTSPEKKFDRMYLHAGLLAFVHPITGEEVRIISETDF